MEFANGDSYTGLWLDDTMHGYGKLVIHATGDVFEGEFDRNIMRGEGTMVYANGDRHVGKVGSCDVAVHLDVHV